MTPAWGRRERAQTGSPTSARVSARQRPHRGAGMYLPLVQRGLVGIGCTQRDGSNTVPRMNRTTRLTRLKR